MSKKEIEVIGGINRIDFSNGLIKVFGWLAESSDLAKPQYGHIFYKGRYLSTLRTGYYRPDLEEKNFKLALSGFEHEFRVPADIAAEFDDDHLNIGVASADKIYFIAGTAARFPAEMEVEVADDADARFAFLKNPKSTLAWMNIIFSKRYQNPEPGVNIAKYLSYGDLKGYSDLFNESATVLSSYDGTPGSDVDAAGIFSEEEYYNNYPDVKNSDFEAEAHFLQYGQLEGRIGYYNEKKNAKISADHYLASSMPATNCHIAQLIISSGEAEAWYGDEPISRRDRFFGSILMNRKMSSDDLMRRKLIFGAATNYLLEKFGHENFQAQLAHDISDIEEYQERIGSTNPISPEIKSIATGGITFITCFYKHYDYFSKLAKNMEYLVNITKYWMPSFQFEWLVMVDDQSYSLQDVEALIPDSIKESTVVKSNGENRGIVYRTNEALEYASYEWIGFLDCDDLVNPLAVLILDFYMIRYPAHYYSSEIVDINSDGLAVRFRGRKGNQDDELERGLLAGHLKVIHRSLFADRRFPSWTEGVQDLWLVLHTCSDIRICYVPEHLYLYRWHGNSQSVKKAAQQAMLAFSIREDVLQSQMAPDFAAIDINLAGNTHFGVVIRTVGERPAGLIEAIASCRGMDTALQTSVCVCVHGNAEKVRYVKSILGKENWLERGLNVYVIDADILAARGAPLNRGIESLLKLGANVFGFLDDDDIYLSEISFAVEKLVRDVRLAKKSNMGIIGKSVFKDQSGSVSQLHKIKKTEDLKYGNFITTNSVLFTSAALVAGIKHFGNIFPEDMHYLEDFFGYLRLFETGTKLSYFDGYIGEFRSGSDGNTEQRQKPLEFNRCNLKVEFFKEKIEPCQWRNISLF